MNPGIPMTCDKEQTNSENGTNGTNPIESDDLVIDVNDLFQLSIEWKFECDSCHRFIVINLKVCFIHICCIFKKTFGYYICPDIGLSRSFLLIL